MVQSRTVVGCKQTELHVRRCQIAYLFAPNKWIIRFEWEILTAVWVYILDLYDGREFGTNSTTAAGKANLKQNSSAFLTFTSWLSSFKFHFSSDRPDLRNFHECKCTPHTLYTGHRAVHEIMCTVHIPQLLNDFLLRQYALRALGDRRAWRVGGITRYIIYTNLTAVDAALSAYDRSGIVAWTVVGEFPVYMIRYDRLTNFGFAVMIC